MSTPVPSVKRLFAVRVTAALIVLALIVAVVVGLGALRDLSAPVYYGVLTLAGAYWLHLQWVKAKIERDATVHRLYGR